MRDTLGLKRREIHGEADRTGWSSLRDLFASHEKCMQDFGFARDTMFKTAVRELETETGEFK